ncbi:MAG: hypothetical protein CO002_00975 [Candidatus Portnoybacteria bacterium CG_4_8_14_3_um_filter_44_10]|uniref:Methyltransferase type 11 domain-containing protein n=3 Tax=Candidatus Portnoyibacteriota TaxID=1817913 RepID=A0A2M7IGI1_9BACT|nr:MAG: hypothetical protein AUK17_00050 [Parcubacteria group bacterium CG2_30_44_18]PIW75630.1 MAG: hypothetical protein CO002_00975 [Candidatus Portnoybacteria bacterium CG_4_8_14_3_um_filter_44_10]PIZ68957.1 MAG: hypothetical protein COY11_05250 [Candidatus Portnoybacteria bacterium CG_4_10_14_0_2_um_filter_44_20]
MFAVLEKWQKEGFNLEERLKRTKGPFIEIGGPTLGDYDMVDIENLERKLHVSNLCQGAPKIREGGILLEGKVDFQADGRMLPFRDNSLGAMFVSCLGNIKTHPYFKKYYDECLREKIIRDSFRALEQGGLLVWQGCKNQDVEFAENIGFKVLKYSGLSNIPYFYCVFEKQILIKN